MKLGKRRKDDDPAGEPTAAPAADAPSGAVTDTWTAPVTERTADYSRAASEPPVDSDAVELPPAPAPMPEPMAPAAPAPPVPLAISEPVRPAASAYVPHPPPVITDPAIAMGNPTPADGHAPADPLMDEIRVLATERPEIVVGAAFAGGILAAMILRRLGN